MKLKRKHLTFICAAACAACLALMVVVLLQGPRREVRFTPPPFDANAVVGVPDLTIDDGYSSLDATVYLFSLCGELELRDDKVDIWLTNHEGNDVWLKVIMKDSEDNKIGETGLVRPGEYVQSLSFASVPAETMDVKMVVMGYEPDTYYSVGNVTLYTTLQVPGSGEDAAE